MRSTLLLGIVLSTGLMAMPASAGYVVSANLTSTPDVDGTDFDYKIVLTNATTSTLPLGTFWFSWVPGQDFMSVKPTNIINPTGWSDLITGGGAGDGFAIQWVAGSTGTPIAPGGSLTFAFTSSETLAQIEGFSPSHPASLETTAFVYTGAPLADPGLQFNVAGPAAVPEPSSLALCGIAGVVGLVVARARRRVSAA
jgi:PEP-CTERM motif